MGPIRNDELAEYRSGIPWPFQTPARPFIISAAFLLVGVAVETAGVPNAVACSGALLVVLAVWGAKASLISSTLATQAKAERWENAIVMSLMSQQTDLSLLSISVHQGINPNMADPRQVQPIYEVQDQVTKYSDLIPELESRSRRSTEFANEDFTNQAALAIIGTLVSAFGNWYVSTALAAHVPVTRLVECFTG